MNKFEFFTPLMHKHEYEFIKKYLNKDDIFLEWGSGHSTLYFSDLVTKVISIEHDIDWINNIKMCVDLYNVPNVELIYIPAHSKDPIPCRYKQFKDYIEYPKANNLFFNKVLIDGRARKYCAKSIYDVIDENVIVMIHDFNRLDYQMALKYFEIIEQLTEGQGIVALKKRKQIVEDNNYY